MSKPSRCAVLGLLLLASLPVLAACTADASKYPETRKQILIDKGATEAPD